MNFRFVKSNDFPCVFIGFLVSFDSEQRREYLSPNGRLGNEVRNYISLRNAYCILEDLPWRNLKFEMLFYPFRNISDSACNSPKFEVLYVVVGCFSPFNFPHGYVFPFIKGTDEFNSYFRSLFPSSNKIRDVVGKMIEERKSYSFKDCCFSGTVSTYYRINTFRKLYSLPAITFYVFEVNFSDHTLSSSPKLPPLLLSQPP